MLPVTNRKRVSTAGLVALTALAALAPSACSSPSEEIGSDESNIAEPPRGIFNATSEVSFEIQAPLNQLITRFRNNQADPPEPVEDGGVASPDKPEYSEPGKLVYGAKTLDIRIAIRGNTSPHDCAFPKYKIEFTEKKQTHDTPFQGNKKFRVNSHCGFGGADERAGRFNRIQNEISPIREELLYRLLRAAGAPTYRTRLAKIAYTDTSSATPLEASAHHGLLIESGDVAAKRFAAAGLIDEEQGIYLNDPYGRAENAGADASLMKDEDVATVYLAEAFAANMDWYFTVGSPGTFWNIDVFGTPKAAPQFPILQDFDLAPTVHVMRDPVSEMNSQMYKFRSQFGSKPEVVKAVSARFKERKAAVLAELAKVESAGIEAGRLPSEDEKTTTDPGFVNAHKLVEAFYALDELQ